MRAPEELADAVRARDQGRCQYCMMLERLQGAAFHIPHIIPQYKGGEPDLDNLALVCPGCSLYKSSRTATIDPVTGAYAPLFHPLIQDWAEHFRFSGHQIEGLTPVGRATVRALSLNHPRRQRIREMEEALGLYPPLGVKQAS